MLTKIVYLQKILNVFNWDSVTVVPSQEGIEAFDIWGKAGKARIV